MDRKLGEDLDDLRRRLTRSQFVFYTDLYDLEGEIFRSCNLQLAIAISLCVDIQKVPLIYKDPHDWIEHRAINWEHWITLCVFPEIFSINCGCGYGRPSAVNRNIVHNTDMVAFETFKI